MTDLHYRDKINYIRLIYYNSHSDGGWGKCDDGGGGEHFPFDPGEYTSGTQNDPNGE